MANEEYVLGAFMEGPNPAACLLKNGELIAMAEEERFVRIKKAIHHQPINAIKYCLKYEGITIDDVSMIAVAWDHTKYPKFMKKFNKKNLKNRSRFDHMTSNEHIQMHDYEHNEFNLHINLSRIGLLTNSMYPPMISIPHHQSHAMGAFMMSGFCEASILIIDGSGEEKTTTMWIGDDSGVKMIKEIVIPNSIGWFYSCITEFLGFKGHSDEGKTMGLASYGKENLWVRKKLKKIINYNSEGDYEVDASYIYFDKRTRSGRFTDKLMDELGEPHMPNTPFTDLHKDIAFETQYILEDIVSRLVKQLIQKTEIRDVCIAGGVGMNCKMNGVINQMKEVDNLFVFPASSDEGTCIGAAMCASTHTTPTQITHTNYGPVFSNDEIKGVLDEMKLKYTYHRNIEKVVAGKLSEDKIVGWFQGRMEFGARALGNRSILANPTNKDMKDIINAHIKHREPFRPFCPSLLYEDKDKYLENAKEAPFMIVAYEAKPGMKDKIPSVVHVDNTVRPQTVRKEVNLKYWNVINEFKKMTGEGIVLNTSFNVRGEPIVCKPIDAIRCFYGTGMDYLAIGDYLLEK